MFGGKTKTANTYQSMTWNVAEREGFEHYIFSYFHMVTRASSPNHV